jgi:hypothetical protein
MGFVLLIFLVFLDLFIALLVLVLCLVPDVALSLDFYCDCPYGYQYKFHVIPNITAGGLLVPEGIIHSVFSDMVYYIYLLLLQLLYKVIIDKTKVLLPRVYVTLADFSSPV